MKLTAVALLLLATLSAPATLAETGCDRTAYYTECTVDADPVCWQITVWADHGEWRQCEATPLPVPDVVGIATQAVEDLTDGTSASCPDDCYVIVDGRVLLCVNVEQQWYLHEPLLCRGIES